jgi:hypothetical protein
VGAEIREELTDKPAFVHGAKLTHHTASASTER